MVSVPGCALLLFPDPFLALARASPEVEAKVRDNLGALAFALPPALLFRLVARCWHSSRQRTAAISLNPSQKASSGDPL